MVELGQMNKGKTQYPVEEPADFSLETKAGELSEGEYKYQYRLALGLSKKSYSSTLVSSSVK